jgi:hypothetical protein
MSEPNFFWKIILAGSKNPIAVLLFISVCAIAFGLVLSLGTSQGFGGFIGVLILCYLFYCFFIRK